MTHADGAERTAPSAVVGEGFVYVVQFVLDYKLKIGWCEPWRLDARQAEHETSGGPPRRCGHAPGSRALETRVFQLLAPWRVKRRRTESTKDYELFLPTPECLRTMRSPEFVSLGFALRPRPKDPRRQTTKDWLEIVKDHVPGRPGEAADLALRENARLRDMVPPSARGGWDLNESLGSAGRIVKQQAFSFDEVTRAVDGWLVRFVTYKGTTFRFPVFAEWYERQNRKPAPKEAILAGVPIQKPWLRSGRAGAPVRRTMPSVPSHDQVPLFGGGAR